LQILALDTAQSACSVAVWRDGTVVARRWESMARGQSEALMPMVRAALEEAGSTFPQLDLLAVTVGPGGFTGLRIGLAAARGMALAAGLPCLGVTTLEAVAHGIPDHERGDGRVLVALDSKRADIFAQVFGPGLKPVQAPMAVLPANLHGLLSKSASSVRIAGDAAPRAAKALEEEGFTVQLSAASGVPDAAVVAEMAANRWKPGDPCPTPAPLYLRQPDATIPRNGGRLRP
jgi:tRNA threonylcarbamoyladenosine biosynthesis protein TsaB